MSLCLFCDILVRTLQSCIITVLNGGHCICIGQCLESTGKCVTISEPESIVDICVLYQKLGDTPKVRELARDVVRMQCRPCRSFEPLAHVIKVCGLHAVTMPLFG